MSGSQFGELFKVSTFGESHGPALGAIIDGCPPGLALSEADIQMELDRRKPGQSKYTTQRRESDTVQILSGVFEGKTTGTAIGLLIMNEDQRSRDYNEIKDMFRPGHADYTYHHKYGIRDYRGGGRSSARETAMRVAAGAIAKKLLSERFGIVVQACLSQMGEVMLDCHDWDAVNQNAFFCAEPGKVTELEQMIDSLRSQGDSIGAKVLVRAQGVPVGWGAPVFDRIDADLAKALMSINAVKAVEIGDGVRCAVQKGSEHRDEITAADGFLSNHSGGVLGGITTGQPVVAQMTLKPTSSITQPGRSVDVHGNDVEVVTKGRHDPCVGIRAVPIAEAMMAIVLVDHYLRHQAQCG